MSSFYLLFIRIVFLGVAFFEVPKIEYMIRHTPGCGTPFCYQVTTEYHLMPQFGGETMLKSGGLWLFLHELISIGLVLTAGLYIVGRIEDRAVIFFHFAEAAIVFINVPHLVTAPPALAVAINLIVIGFMFRWLNHDNIKKYFVLVSAPVWLFDYFAFFGFVFRGGFTHWILELIGWSYNVSHYVGMLFYFLTIGSIALVVYVVMVITVPQKHNKLD